MPRAPEATVEEGAALSRRSLLQSAAALAGGLVIGIEMPARRALAAGGDAASAQPGAQPLNAFVHVPPQGPVRLVMPAVEMGQGVYTSQAQCLAEELDLALDQIVAEHAPADQAHYGNPIFVVQATGGSTSTMAWTLPLRKAGATARALLVAAAAAEWKVDAATLVTAKGAVTHPPTGRSLAYGALAARAATLPAPGEVKLRATDQFRLIGKPAPRIDTPDKVAGRTTFGIDILLPGMTFAAPMAPPVIGGKVVRVDDAAARALPGVRQVVVLDDMVAVVGDTTWAARQGLEALKVTWDDGPNANLSQARLWADIEAAANGPGVTARKEGDALAQLSSGTTFEAAYELPFLAHTPMEPLNCTVHVHDGQCEVWVGTQVPGFAQAGAAKVLGIAPEKVTIHNHLIGGGFGRRLEADYVIAATRIAQKVNGPVKVIWSREEDIRQDLFRPLYHERIKARVENGRITAWHHRVTGASILARWLPPAFQNGIDIDAIDGAAEPPYAFDSLLVEYIRHESAVPVGFWRGVGPNGAVFGVECFLDLIARKTGTDPLALRRGLVEKNPRARAVLDQAAAKAGWGTPLAASRFGARTGRGVALMHAFGSYLACVAEVAVDDKGAVLVTRVVVVADVGQMVNPDIVRAQIQGGVTFGISTVLNNQITIAGGRVEQSNFDTYELIRIDDMPTIEVELVASTEAPGGIGEPGTVIVQPAVANAIFAATGVQQTRMPIDAKRIAKAG